MVILQLTKCSVLGKLFKFQALVSPSVKWDWASQVAHWQRIHLLNRGCRFSPWIRKIPWRRKCQPTPVFLTVKFHGQRSLAGYSHKESDTAELSTHARVHGEIENPLENL